MQRKEITFDSFIRGVIAGSIIFGLLYLINYLSGVLLPFFIAWLIAYLIYPIVIFFQNKLRLRNRALSISVVMLLLIGLIVLGTVVIIPPIMEEAAKLKEIMTAFLRNGAEQSSVPTAITQFIKENSNLAKTMSGLDADQIGAALKDLLPKAWNILAQSLNIVASILASFIILLYMFFILLDYEKITTGWAELLPKRHRTLTVKIVNDVKDNMNRYFRGQSLVALLVGILFSIGFLIIDFPLAIGFGLFIGLLNMVPYLQLLALIPTVLLSLLKAADTGENFWVILALAIAVFCIVQAIQDFVIVPKIMGKITGLNPAIILLSLSIWGSLMGIVGMIIALPCTSLLVSYYQRYLKHKDISEEETE